MRADPLGLGVEAEAGQPGRLCPGDLRSGGALVAHLRGYRGMSWVRRRGS